MVRLGLACLFATALAATGSAQRSPFFATVVGPDGRPMAGAEVSCVFTPDVVTPWAKDIVVATSDARGRARCELLAGRLYVAWAVGAADQTGAYFATDPVPLVAAGRVVELRALEQQLPRRVQLVDHQAWREVGAVGLRWFPDANQDLHRDLPLPTGDVVDLPASPWANACLALTDAAGEVLVSTMVGPGAGVLRGFAPPIAVVANVTDNEGQPLAGATIEHFVQRNSGHWALFRSGFGVPQLLRVVGMTGSDGCLRFHAPMPLGSSFRGQTSPGTLPVFARKAGFEPQPQAVADAGEITFRLRPEATTTIRLLGAGADRTQVLAIGPFQLRPAGGGMMVLQQPLAVERAPDEHWVVHAASKGFALRLSLPSTLPTSFVHDWIQDPPAQLTIDLAAKKNVEVHVVDAAGGPAACALGVTRASKGSPLYWDAVLASDLGGRAALRLPAGDFYVYATNGPAHALARVDLDANQPLVLQLEPLPTMRVRVLDAEGKPVAGARAAGHESSYSSPSGDEVGRQWDRLASELWWCYAPLARSDDDGVMHIPAFVRKGLTAKIAVNAEQRSTEPFVLRPEGNDEVIVRE